MKTNLDGMRRWGYICLTPPPDKPGSKKPNEKWMIALTEAGYIAQQTWRPLPSLIEARWRERFGDGPVDSLRSVLLQANNTLDIAYPDFLPILRYGLFTFEKNRGSQTLFPALADAPLAKNAPLTALLSRLLVAFAYDFEQESPFSLAISANVLSPLNVDGFLYKKFPQHSGVSKNAVAVAAGFLHKAGLITMEGGANRTIRLTECGIKAQRGCSSMISEIERMWQKRLGNGTMEQLRTRLEHIAGDPQVLLLGMRPQALSWRASLPAPQALPRFPLVLHRGGYPDGS